MTRRDSLSEMDTILVTLLRPNSSSAEQESMATRILRVQKDLQDLNNFYNIAIAPRRYERLRQWYADEMESLFQVDFDALDQEGKVDFLLLRNFLRRNSRQLEAEWEALKLTRPVVPFAPLLVELLENRQDVVAMEGDKFAKKLDDVRSEVVQAHKNVESGGVSVEKLTGLKAAGVVEELQGLLDELYFFYRGYDPSFDWWVSKPYNDTRAALVQYVPLVKSKLAGLSPDKEDEIVGEPIGREALLVELDAEMIAYSPEELISLANEQFAWCEKQMKQAALDLKMGEDWKAAMEYVKELYVPPGEQPQMVKALALEGAAFVKQHGLVTVPPLADETIRMFMIPPAQQKVSPFFLGGPSILVSYPTPEMPHDLKKMVMRGNNPHFSRATAFHELVPGHRLQMFHEERYSSHRRLFRSAFYTEGWAMYWEMVFWERGDFFVLPEDRVGTMFWRMHRCARIILSLKYHLGQMTPQECVDVLVSWVGHERSTAEGEVRRWLNGSYPPLYQAGYMLGALQLMALRREVLAKGVLGEKQLNDTVLRANAMPIELMRALILGKELTPLYKPQWKFYH